MWGLLRGTLEVFSDTLSELQDHLERMEELKSLHNMNRIDYLDIKEKLGSK